MKYTDAMRQLSEHRTQIANLRDEMRAIQQEVEPHAVIDYVFEGPDGSVRLSELFGGHRDLLVIHNMGRGCAYCTLWADGYNGVYHHLTDRAAFVVSTPDPAAVQAAFAASRGWRFPMVSHRGTTFAADMGYADGARLLPGVSVFQQAGDGLVRVSDSGSCPGDDYCAVWHLFDLLPGGAADWQPTLRDEGA